MKITKLKSCIVYDQVLAPEQEQEMISIVEDSRFIWTDYCDHTIEPELQDKDGDTHTEEMSQFVSIQVDNNEGRGVYCNKFGDILRTFLAKNMFSAEYVLRIKVNLQKKNPDYPEDSYATPHVDYDVNHNVLLYYIDDSDGDTLFFNKVGDTWEIVDRVTPKKGRFVLFAGDQYHSGQAPRIAERRLVVNIDFK